MWPTGRQVLKNAGVVLATILIIGVAVFAVDWCLTEVFKLAKEGAVQLGEQYAIEETTTGAAETTTAAGETTTAAGETTTGAEESTAVDETTTEGSEDTTAEVTTAETTTAA